MGNELSLWTLVLVWCYTCNIIYIYTYVQIKFSDVQKRSLCSQQSGLRDVVHRAYTWNIIKPSGGQQISTMREACTDSVTIDMQHVYMWYCICIFLRYMIAIIVYVIEYTVGFAAPSHGNLNTRISYAQYMFALSWCSRPWFIGEFGDQGQPHDILKQDVQAVQKQPVKTRVPQVGTWNPSIPELM